MPYVLRVCLFYFGWMVLSFSSLAQYPNRLILKLKPDYRQSISDRQSSLNQLIGSFGLLSPTQRFPGHVPIRYTNTVLGKSLVDLSLIYEMEVPAPLRSSFVLRQLAQREELVYAEWEMNDAFPLSNPNDPKADTTSGSQRQVLKKIKAYQAWTLSQGDTNVVIGVLDTGIPVDHEDIISQVKINPLDPPNGLDDDGNGLIDDYRGWDFGSNDNNPTPDNTGTAPGHGTSVTSLAGAATNNAKGIAGVGYKCKILPLKIWKWNNSFSNFKGYDAIVYAADHGCKVINCSWGSARSGNQFEQDIINYATFNRNSIVVAAGGNSPGYYNYLPANYENAFGVTMSDTTDQIFWAASYHFNLDATAPGVNIYGIQTNGNYGWVEGGSSMASPLAAGAVGLICSKFPELTGLQAGELLRVNTDDIFSLPGNSGYRNKAGRGRINIEKALQKVQSISLRAAELQIRNKKGLQALAGDTVAFLVRFENYLDSVPSFTFSATTDSPKIQFLNSNVTQVGMGTLTSRWTTVPVFAVVGQSVNPEEEIDILITVSVGAQYTDTKGFRRYFNGSFLDLDANEVRITVTQNGMEGYADLNNLVGSGIRYRNQQWSGDAGLMIGTSATKLPNSVYDTTGKDADFRVENPIRFQEYGFITQHAVNHFNDSAIASKVLGLRVKQSAFEMNADSLMGSVFLSYQVKNLRSDTLDSLCVAHYNDWEVENLNFNFARWDSAYRMGYTVSAYPRVRYAAVQVLSPGEPQFYAIDALPNSNNGNINLFDGFSLTEKWKTMSSGIGRRQAGSTPLGNNIVQVTGLKIRNLEPGEIRKLTFAYVFADSLPELKAKARANQNFFNGFNISLSPLSKNQFFCAGDTVSESIHQPNGIQKFKVYGLSGSVNPIYSGTHFEAKLYSDSSLYIAGNDSLFEGPREEWKYEMKPKPLGQFSYLPLPGDSIELGISLIFNALDTSNAFQNRWTVDGELQPDTSKSFTLLFNSVKTVQICLHQTGRASGCADSSCKSIRVFQLVGVTSLLQNSGIRVFPNPAQNEVSIFVQNPDLRLSEIGIELFDIQGKQAISDKFTSESNRINLADLPKGLYLARIRLGQHQFTQKLIKE